MTVALCLLSASVHVFLKVCEMYNMICRAKDRLTILKPGKQIKKNSSVFYNIVDNCVFWMPNAWSENNTQYMFYADFTHV